METVVIFGSRRRWQASFHNPSSSTQQALLIYDNCVFCNRSTTQGKTLRGACGISVWLIATVLKVPLLGCNPMIRAKVQIYLYRPIRFIPNHPHCTTVFLF